VIRFASGLLLLLVTSLVLTPSAQVPQRDQPPAYIEAARLEAQLRGEIAAEGLTRERATKLASLLGRQGRTAEAIDVVEELGRVQAGDPTVHYLLVTYCEEVVRKGQLTPDEKAAFIAKGLAAADRAIALDPQYAEAITYKNILLRHQTRLEMDPARQQALIAEADRLRVYAMELLKERRASGAAPGVSGVPPPPPPPPSAPIATPPCDRNVSATLQAPVRVGGNIRPPTKVHDARPVYPIEAQDARVQGVVIVEATIDESGRVVQACVLRSIPMLDEAALQAVGQWEFTPTLLNGNPVPVIMTVTVNFTLQ
jgi:TonB family protein